MNDNTNVEQVISEFERIDAVAKRLEQSSPRIASLVNASNEKRLVRGLHLKRPHCLSQPGIPVAVKSISESGTVWFVSTVPGYEDQWRNSEAHPEELERAEQLIAAKQWLVKQGQPIEGIVNAAPVVEGKKPKPRLVTVEAIKAWREAQEQYE